jgi:hypothetical protein
MFVTNLEERSSSYKSSTDSAPGRQTSGPITLHSVIATSGPTDCGVHRQYKARIEHSPECPLVPAGTAPTVPAFSSLLNCPIEQTQVILRPLLIRML